MLLLLQGISKISGFSRCKCKDHITIGIFSCSGQVSNNGTLLRSHARKVPGWRCALGSPFCIPDLDDELYLHCYVRDAERLHSTLSSNVGYPVLPRPDAGPRGCTGPSHHKLIPHKLLVSVPWAVRASDIALHVAEGEELQVVVAPNGSLASTVSGGSRGPRSIPVATVIK